MNDYRFSHWHKPPPYHKLPHCHRLAHCHKSNNHHIETNCPRFQRSHPYLLFLTLPKSLSASMRYRVLQLAFIVSSVNLYFFVPIIQFSIHLYISLLFFFVCIHIILQILQNSNIYIKSFIEHEEKDYRKSVKKHC